MSFWRSSNVGFRDSGAKFAGLIEARASANIAASSATEVLNKFTAKVRSKRGTSIGAGVAAIRVVFAARILAGQESNFKRS